ncbi:MAG: GlxA family transcriptional regulator [Gammaproteobacteria bacterium]
MSEESPKQAPRRIAMLIYEDCDIIDACAPLDVFSTANIWLQGTGETNSPSYTVSLIAERQEAVRTFSGIRVLADHGFGEHDEGIDTLLVAGGPYIDVARRNPALVDWLKNMPSRVRRIGSICTGAFLLAESGILEGRRATTHWGYCQRLADEFPDVSVEPDRIFVQDCTVYSSGGVTAGIDLALYLVEGDFGHEVALATAQNMVTFPNRPGGQTQFSRFLLGENRAKGDVRKLQEWIGANPQEDLSVKALAQRMCMSPRNFSRRFEREVGMPPAKFVETARLTNASFLLEQTLLPINTIAERCGFGSAENMRRTFLRHRKVSPQDYRKRFRSPRYETLPASEVAD